jgi:hypothetical protein
MFTCQTSAPETLTAVAWSRNVARTFCAWAALAAISKQQHEPIKRAKRRVNIRTS